MYVEFVEAGLFLIGGVLGPEVGIADEEALGGCETVYGGGLGAVQGVPVSCPGNAESALVGDILTEGEGSVCMNTGENLHIAVLLLENGGLGLEGGLVLGCPPVVHVAVLVEEAALVVEAVGHLVADDYADGSVVDGVIRVCVEERGLENGGREAYLVGGGVVVGVDGLRSHAPLVGIGGLSELAEIVLHVPGLGGTEVLVVAQGGIDGQGAVVLPLVGVADLYGEGGELLAGVGLGGVGHPVEGVDVLAE